MNKNRSSWFLAPLLSAAIVLAFAVAGCSSVNTRVDKGRVTARTFSFLEPGSRQTPSYANNRKQAHEMLQRAMIQNLAAKGVTYVASGGDVTVAYLVIVGNNVTTTSLNSYFGYSEDSEALLSQVHEEQTGNSNQRTAFEAGTLVIDFVDPHTSELLQRRSIKAQVLQDASLETRAARVQAIVDQALQDVAISQ